MKKQTHQMLIDYFKDIIPQLKKEAFERQRQTDNVVIWITGLSGGAIALLFSYANSISFIPSVSIIISVLFFMCTIIAGVVFRAYIYDFERLDSLLLAKFEAYCYGSSYEPSGPIEITEHHTIQDIAESLKKDMGLDYDDWLKIEGLNREFWVKHYRQWADFWKRSEEEGIKSLGRAFAPLLYKTPEETEDIFFKKGDSKEIIQRASRLQNLCNKAYTYMLIFFGLSFITISISFIFA